MILALALLALGGFLFLCLVSYHAADLPFNCTQPNEIPLNYGGVAGAWTAFGLMLLLGPCAVLVPPVLLVASIILYRRGLTLAFFARTFAGLAGVAFASMLAGILAPGGAHARFEGLLVREVSQRLLLVNLGQQGSSLVLAALVLMCAVVLFHITGSDLRRMADTVFAVASMVFRACAWLLRLVSGKRPARTARPAPRPARPEPEEDAQDETPLWERPVPPVAKLPEPEEPEASTPSAARPLRPAALAAQGEYVLPDLALLDELPPPKSREIKEDLSANSAVLESTLRDFGIEARVVGATKGPVITCYELHPSPGVKVQKIVGLADDLALALKAISIRVLAPIPGKAAVGIEVPNSKVTLVFLRELLDSEAFRKNTRTIPLVLGKDITGNPLISDLADMPHLLIAGSTGSGKTVCVNAIITGILFMAHPDNVKFVMIDPKIVEMADYKDIPHLICPIISDPKKASRALQWLVREMEHRYKLLDRARVRNIRSFNERDRSIVPANPDEAQDLEALPERLPYIVVIIDELADLMMVASTDIENSIVRLAQMARAVGIHLIIATQRPSVDVLTGIIKANFQARISFKVASKVDSRTILDANGADKLLGKGDMLFLQPGNAKLTRAQGALVQDREIRHVVEFIRSQRPPAYAPNLNLETKTADGEDGGGASEKDSLYNDAVRVVLTTGQPSVSMIQRKLRLGYTRAARIMDMMEEEGIVGPPDPVTKTREILSDVLD